LKRYAPFFLVLAVILLDQLTKLWIVAAIPAYDFSQYKHILGESFLRFVHVKNTGIAFSIGQDAPAFLRLLLFKILPLAVMGYLGYLIYNREKEGFTRAQAWYLAGIMGGGLGNLVDRIFRPDGVVDWIDFEFFGLFGWDRFPTFNIADSSVTICAFLILLSIVRSFLKKEKKSE